MKTRYTGAALASFLMLSGCASTPPMTIALTEMGTATKTDKGSKNVRQMRVVNATGLGAEDVVGSYTMDPDPYLFELPPFFGSDDFPDSLATRIKPGCSWIVEKKYGDDVKPEDVHKLREKLIELDAAAIEAARAERNKAILKLLHSQLSAIPTGDAGKKLRDKLFSLSTQIDPSTKDEQSLRTAINIPEPKDDNPETKTKSTEPKVENSETNTKVPEPKADNPETKTKSPEPKVENSEKNTKIPEQKSENPSTAYLAKKKEVDALVAKTGIVVTQWSRTTKAGANADITGAVSAGAAKEKEVHGYLVMGGLRTTTLLVGKDLLDAAKKGPLSGVKPSRLFVTQHSQSAKHLSWGETRSGSLTAALQVDIQKLLSMAAGLEAALPGLLQALKDIPLSVGVSYASNYAAENTGTLSGGEKKIYPFNFGDGTYEEAWKAELKRSDGYSTVYASRSTLVNLVKGLNEGTVPDTTDCTDKDSKKESPLPLTQ